MPNLNHVMLIGHLGHDPEERHTSKGTPLVAFRMATTKRWKNVDSQEWNERTEWHRVVVFGKQAEVLAGAAKTGSLVHVEGSLRTRDWTDKEGVKRYTTEIVARSVQLLDKKERPEEPAQKTEEPPVERPEFEEDIPF